MQLGERVVETNGAPCRTADEIAARRQHDDGTGARPGVDRDHEPMVGTVIEDRLPDALWTTGGATRASGDLAAVDDPRALETDTPIDRPPIDDDDGPSGDAQRVRQLTDGVRLRGQLDRHAACRSAHRQRRRWFVARRG